MGTWFGSKATTGALPGDHAPCSPRHQTYLETHLGGGAIMKRKPPVRCAASASTSTPGAIRNFSCAYEVELVHGCCHRFLAAFPFEGSELVYSDPPYLHSVRRSERRYRHDYAEADHEELLALLRGLPCSVMISGYPSALYDRELKDWRSMSIQVMNQAGVVTEKIWFNFDPDRPHWHSHAGKNNTDRQRIKRLAESWARRYRARPPGERLAVLAAVMAVEAE